MALVSCPECKKQISDTTPSCPHCGYQLSITGSQTAKPTSVSLTPTKISEVLPNYGVGITLIVVGVLCLFASFFAFFMFFIFGLIVFTGTIFIFTAGAMKIAGHHEAYCPHCGKLIHIQKNAGSLTCPVCKKTSVRDGEYLKPIS